MNSQDDTGNNQETINYHRIAEAIEYIRNHFKQQPDLDRIAESIHLSPAHFQRLFTQWAGTSPKKFLQYTSIEYAKWLLEKEHPATLFDVAFETGLSSTSRLHDLFIKIEGMSPAEYKNGGRTLSINYQFADTPFGNLIAASTQKGICYMAFDDNKKKAADDLKSRFPNATFREQPDQIQQNALLIFREDWSQLPQIRLHLKGTVFQLKVWESLLKIPMGRLSTYSAVAARVGMPRAARAVGTAIGDNPIAYLIPCHRVIRSSGIFGGYMWGSTRKAAMIGWEGVRVNQALF